MGGSEDVVGEEDGRLGTGREIGRLLLVERLFGEVDGGVVCATAACKAAAARRRARLVR